jgi:hypothetical protein
MMTLESGESCSFVVTSWNPVRAADLVGSIARVLNE